MRQILSIIALLTFAISAHAQEQQQQQPRQKSLRVGEINEGDTRKVETRVKSLRLTSVGLGPFGSNQVDGKPLHYGGSVYKHFEAGVNGEILLGAFGAFSSESSFLFAGIGGSYLFSTEDISPILGGEFGLGAAHYNRPSDSSVTEGGFAAKLDGGVRFFRTSDTQMEVLASYTGLFSTHNPGVYGVEVRVLF
jgi:hypothetical protein